MKKLSNERFVNNAPEQVIANERKKQSDAEAKIKTIQEQLSAFNNYFNIITELKVFNRLQFLYFLNIYLIILNQIFNSIKNISENDFLLSSYFSFYLYIKSILFA